MTGRRVERRARTVAYIGLGANLGDPVATLRGAFDEIARLRLTGLLARSSLYRSAPVDAAGPDFVNAVACVGTDLSARELMAALHAIEHAHGRERTSRHAPRTLDLDLLLYGDERHDEPTLHIPHPRLHERAFVLRPLAEISPDLSIEGHGLLADLLPAVAAQRVDRL